ncbi:DUF4280 domain-containing protein, partial [Dysgonomonas sp. OttesenSCG-928-D17]|nr:DUF4280 domain-containing protein [Dysgonomonas sp. OttesenSCG-928-D17]
MNDNTITLNQQPRARQIDSNVNIQPQNQNKENSVEEATSIETSNMSGKSTPESGAYLVCKGATCKCEFGSAMLKIEVISQSKAYINDASARQKLIATIKDNVFPPPFFGQCTKNPATGKPCMYSPQDWELTPSTEHPEVNTLLVLTENAYIQCPKFQGKITIVTHGQEITVDSDSIEELDELEALAINCLFEPLEPADDIKKAIVDNIEYNGQKSGNSDLMKVRMNKEIIFKANYRGDKRNISWQLWEKTENLDINDKTSFIYKQQGEELKLLFPKEGKFSLEGFGAFLDARSKEDTSCILKFEVTDKNEITHLSRSNGQVYEPDTLIPLVRKKTYTFTIESLFPFEEEEIETLIVTIKDGRGSILSKGYSHTKDTIIFTPDNVAKYNIFISLGAEGISKTFQIDAQNNEITS